MKTFTSTLNLGDSVSIILDSVHKIRWCYITAIKFEDTGDIKYDVKLGGTTGVKFYDIPSNVVEPTEVEPINTAKSELQ